MVPSLPNWGYGLYLDPKDMMERVFGPSKYAREESKTRDTQFAAQHGLQEREGAMRLMELVSIMPDSPEKTQLMQQVYNTLGVQQQQQGGGDGQGIDPSLLEPRQPASKLPAWINNVAGMVKSIPEAAPVPTERGSIDPAIIQSLQQGGSPLGLGQGQPSGAEGFLQGIAAPQQQPNDILQQLALEVEKIFGQGQKPRQVDTRR